MSDLIERLRHADAHSQQRVLGSRIFSEAADEIERMRNFLGKVQGVCMGVAMSGRDHPNPDGALMGLFNEAQAILFPPATTARSGGDHGAE